MGIIIDLTGERFGRLIAVERLKELNNSKGTMWLCKCDCGNEKVVSSSNLRRGLIKSCWCIRKEVSKYKNYTHGKTGTPLYNVWYGMRQRCYYEKHNRYEKYGGRGIIVCEEWKNSFQSFYDWAVQNGYNKGLSIDRIDVNGNYEPSNCKFSTMTEQANNKTTSHFLTFNGKTQTISQWSHELNISRGTLRDRITKRKWSVERALTQK